MEEKEIDILTSEEKATLHRLQMFAKKNNLVLFNVQGSLFDRVRTITRLNGACDLPPVVVLTCPQ